MYHPRLCLVLILGSGCATTNAADSGNIDARLQNLEQEEARRTADLVELEREIEAAEITLEHALAEATRADCSAKKALLEARLTERVARCGTELAHHEACLARAEAHSSKGAAVGCGLGLLAALATGGAAAPLGLAGCAGGAAVGKATSTTCGAAPACFATIRSEHRESLGELRDLAECAGEARRRDRSTPPSSGSQPRPGPQVHP